MEQKHPSPSPSPAPEPLDLTVNHENLHEFENLVRVAAEMRREGLVGDVSLLVDMHQSSVQEVMGFWRRVKQVVTEGDPDMVNQLARLTLVGPEFEDMDLSQEQRKADEERLINKLRRIGVKCPIKAYTKLEAVR